MARSTMYCGFLSLPSELRNQVYRLVFCHADIIRYTKPDSDDNGTVKLSGQFLRTCRQIYNEGLSILYGDNTFHIVIPPTVTSTLTPT